MKLLHVIPIVRGFTKDQLSYFTLKDIPKGSLISVPMRNRDVTALVVDTENVEDAKTQLRHQTFAVKKVNSDEYSTLLLPEFVETAKALSHYFVTSHGSVLHQIVPKVILDNAAKFPQPKISTDIESPITVSEKLTFQADEENRFADYRSLVRESFARNTSVFITTPTVREAEYISSILNKGIEDYVVVLHGSLTPKEQFKRITKVLEQEHPVLIVGTAPFLSVPRTDVDIIIVERETARSYKSQNRPFIDNRIFARMYAEARGARLILADFPLSIESTWRGKSKEYEEFSGNRGRTIGEAHQYIIDMRPDPESEDKTFHLLSSQVIHALEDVVKRDKHAFVFTARRGLAPSTVCEDCGSTVVCQKCGANVVLHAANQTNIFVCHTCGEHRSAKERCGECHSWKLKGLGIGSDRLHKDLQDKFGIKKVFIIDADHTKTFAQAKKTAEQFYKTKGSILVGTELALSFLNPSVAVTAIASIDSLLSLPDAKIYEHIFSLLLRIRSRATDSFFIQTRQPELSVIEYAVSGNAPAFYDKEILERRKFDYPPFSVLIKISAHGTPKEASSLLEFIEGQLKDYSFSIYPGFTPTKKGVYILSGLLKVPQETWPDNKILKILRSLPPSVSINVSPESTL